MKYFNVRISEHRMALGRLAQITQGNGSSFFYITGGVISHYTPRPVGLWIRRVIKRMDRDE